MKTKLTLVLVSLATALFATTASAQIRVQVSPQIFERVISPGGTLNDRLRFTNAGTIPLEVSLELADLDVDEAGNAVKFPPATQPHSLAPYLRVTPIKATIEPGQSMNYRLVAKLPAEFDHRRLMLYFLSKPVLDDEAGGSRTIVVPKVGVPVYVESRAANAARLDVSEVEWSRIEGDQLELRMTTRNEGERSIRPPGSVEVSSRDGSFYEVFDLNDGVAPVLPGHVRHWAFAVGPVPGGELSAKLIFATTLRDSFVREYEIAASGDLGAE